MKVMASLFVWPLLLAGMAVVADDEPPALNPFAPRHSTREDAVQGCIELSSGEVFPGTLFLTRDTRLRIYDERLKRHREIPLPAVRSIVCKVEKEWLEKEWRFKENANDEKIYTGRHYPARQHRYEITLSDDRTINGTISGIIYLSAYDDPRAKPRKFLLQKRAKGSIGSTLESLVYLAKVDLGEKAMRDGQRRKTLQSQQKDTSDRETHPRQDRKPAAP